jgi:hypothetical protein
VTYFGPFEIVFHAKGPGHLALLGGIDRADADDIVERINQALAAPAAPLYAKALLSGPDWRLHLVGAVAHLLDQAGRLDRHPLWHAIDTGSWVTPQLVAAAALRDEQFAMKARTRIEQGCPIFPADLTGLEEHLYPDPQAATRAAARCWRAYSAYARCFRC